MGLEVSTMALALLFCRLIVRKEAAELSFQGTLDDLAQLLWPLYIEDEHLMSCSTMSYDETRSLMKEVEERGLRPELDMAIVYSGGPTVEWLKVGEQDGYRVCWLADSPPGSVVASTFFHFSLPGDAQIASHLSRCGSRSRQVVGKNFRLLECRRNNAEASLELSSVAGQLKVRSVPASPRRRAHSGLDQALIREIGECLEPLDISSR